MSADELVQYLSWTIFTLIFGVVSIQAIRTPRRATIHIALLFSDFALIIALGAATRIGLVAPGIGLSTITATLLLAVPYLLLLLVDDMTVLPGTVLRLVGLLCAGALVCVWLIPQERPVWLDSLLLLYVVGVLGYVVVASLLTTAQVRGVTRRRMTAVTFGSLFLVLNLFVGSLVIWLPARMDVWRVSADIFGLLAGISYFLGFAPPAWLRRAWQEPELRAFLLRAARLPHLPDTAAIVQELKQGAAMSVGTPGAALGLHDAERNALRFIRDDSSDYTISLDVSVPATQAFRSQRPVFSPDTSYVDATITPLDLSVRAKAVLAAPITAGAKRLGVLVVFAPRAPLFADDDLALVQLLADQAAVILESRAMIDEATAVYAREQAARLKEEFLAAAAHDLKTPLTTVIARAQLLERRALRHPDTPADIGSIQVLTREAQRLKRLVMELLDAARAEQGQLVGDRTEIDLVALAEEVCAQQATAQHVCRVQASEPVIGDYDEVRIRQILENLVDNAIKYSPQGGEVQIVVRREHAHAHIDVIDHGIGIPPEDLPLIFNRFYRAGNASDQRFSGMGLGLFICQRIVQQHGGQIGVSSHVGQGSTFHIELPLRVDVAAVAESAA